MSVRLLGLLLLSGCTATVTTTKLVQAEQALREAREVGADVHATFEYTVAARSYEQALELSSHSQWKAAHELAETALSEASRATEKATHGDARSLEVEDAGEDIAETEQSTAEIIESEQSAPEPEPPREYDGEDFGEEEEAAEDDVWEEEQ